MKPKKQASEKHQAVKQNNKRITIVTVAAAALFVFMVVGGHAMLSRIGYQRRVTTKQHQAIDTLKADQAALNALVNQYKVFNNANPNMLGVNNTGTTGDQGSNARIVLDALPSQYDFPALTSSIEKILSSRGVAPDGITGTDVAPTSGAADTSSDPQPVPIQFTFSATTTYENSQALLNDFKRSIRPFKTINFSISAGTDNQIAVNATMETYFQPSKKLGIKSLEVK